MSAKDSPPTIPEYVSQADIDALLQGAGAAQAADDAPGGPQLTAAAGDADEVVISQADIDALLQGAGAAQAADDAPGGPQLTAAAGDADEVVISQADIDALLQGAGAHDQKGENGNPPGADHASPNADGGSGEEIFISQADIDALIKSESVVASADIAFARPGLTADPDAQTAVADEARPPASQNQPGRDGQKAEALPPSPSGRDGAAPQKVILAASDGEQPPPLEAGEDKPPASGRWLFSRTLWTVAAVLLILMSTVTSFYFYKHQTPSRGAATGPQAFPISQTSAAAQAFDPSGAAGLTLKGFVVPAPPDKKGVAGLIVDVELALFDAAGAAEIKKYEPYFRSLVYGSLFDALADPKHPEIDELALMARIKNSLNRALPQENIRRVALENLRLL